MLAKQNQDTKTQARKKGQRGAALVETALVFTATVSMILFIVDMGRILLTQQFISERARVGVRNAVVNNWNATSVQNYVVYGTTSAPDGGGAGYARIQAAELGAAKCLGISGARREG